MVGALMLLVALSVTAQESSTIVEPSDREKPFIIVEPERPLAGEDSVLLTIIVGTAGNSCEAPMFQNMSFTITEMAVDSDKDYYNVNVTFEEYRDSTKGCIALYDPVDYGPRFMLGKLRPGIYVVRWDVGNSVMRELIYGEFEVFEVGVDDTYSVHGIVYDDPSPLKRASMPIEGAMVYLIQHVIVSVADQELSSDRVIAPERLIDSVKTGEDGAYIFENLASGGYEILATHPDYISTSVEFTLTDDRIFNLVMIPIDARAAVGGTVSVVSEEDGAYSPLAGCTVSVARALPIATSAGIEIVVPVEVEPARLMAITGDDGSYLIEGIPIASNGEVWYVTAQMGERFNETKPARLSNGQTTRLDFALMVPYQNSSSVEVDGVIFTTATSKQVYHYREPVKVRYSITNTTDEEVVFGPFINDRCVYDLEISSLSEVVPLYRYRMSDLDLMECVGGGNELIRVKPGETVVHDFPEFYFSDLPKLDSTNLIDPTERLEPVSGAYQVAAQVRGEEYNYTMASVTIVINYDPPVGVETQAAKKMKSTVRYNGRNGKLSLTLDRAQDISIAFYTLKGAVVPGSSFSKRLPAGAHTLPLQTMKRSRGLYIVGVKGAGFEKRFPSVYSGR
jgi:hypothetical protein